jgi:hypothetical protein
MVFLPSAYLLAGFVSGHFRNSSRVIDRAIAAVIELIALMAGCQLVFIFDRLYLVVEVGRGANAEG